VDPRPVSQNAYHSSDSSWSRHGRAALTLAIYAKVMVRRDGEPERLRALVNGDELHPKGAGSRETAEGAMP
jgi:hypothetical protein